MNVLERAGVLSGDDIIIRAKDLPNRLLAPTRPGARRGARPTTALSLEELERRDIERVLHEWGRSKRQRLSSGSIRRLYGLKRKRYGIE